jgi:hypothetical protein
MVGDFCPGTVAGLSRRSSPGKTHMKVTGEP